jgi:hypothetical protein
VLLQNGSERAGVNQALRDVQALDPNHAESRRSLETRLKDAGNHKNGA